MNLKGQNLRILLTEDGSPTPLSCVAMAVSCNVQLTNNTEESSTKDVVGNASQPTVVSKGWQVQVESLNVADVAALLAAIKRNQVFTLIWDETNTTNNQSPLAAGFARQGKAYLSDATFNFNDRENSTKNITFIGTSELETIETAPQTSTVTTNTFTKGQFVRLFLSDDNTATPSKVIAAAKQLSLHVAVQMEESSTKDTSGDWLIQEPVSISFDISTTALVRSGETISSSVGAQTLSDIETIYEAGTPVKFKIANVSGDNNRTAGTSIMTGSVIVQTLTLNGVNRQNADYTAQLVGFGAWT